MGAGDSQLDLAPPNAEQTQPPAATVTEPQAPTAGNETTAAPEEQANAADGAAVAAVEQELAAARRELKEATDRHLRLAAEFDNYRKRVERERAELQTGLESARAGKSLLLCVAGEPGHRTGRADRHGIGGRTLRRRVRRRWCCRLPGHGRGFQPARKAHDRLDAGSSRGGNGL